MRIVYFSPHPTHDIVSNVGYSTHQREMILALRNLGHEVIPVIVGGTIESELPKQTKEGQSSTLVQGIKRWIPGIIWRTIKDLLWLKHDRYVAGPMLKKALEEYKPDLVYERSEYSLKQGVIQSNKAGVAHILEVNAPCVEEWIAFEGKSLLTGNAERIERIKYKLASGLCPVSSPLGRFLSETYNVESSRINPIPNAIRPNAISYDLERVEAIRDRLNVKVDDTVIGFVGSILAYHGLDMLVEVFLKIAAAQPNLKLLIVGDGAMLPELKQLVEVSKLDDRVTFTGKVPYEDVFNLIQVMDICVNPKHSWYGSPIKIFEYAAMGKAIIAPNDDNIQDVLVNRKSAMLINPSNDELEAAISELVQNTQLRNQLGLAAKEAIMMNHTWAKNAERVIEFALELKDQ